MLKKLRGDDGALEGLVPVLVFIAAFIVISSTVIASMQDAIEDAQGGNWQYASGSGLYGDIEYNLWNPDEGVDVTDMTVINRYDSFRGDEEVASREVFYLVDPDEEDRYLVNVINDNELWSIGWHNLLGFRDERRLYNDYVMVAQEYGWFSVSYTAISYDQIKQANMGTGNTSLVPFVIHGHEMTLIVQAFENSTGATFRTCIDLNLFNLKLGVVDDDNFTAIAHSSIWNILGQMLTMQLPESTPFVDLLVAVPLWTGVAVCFFIFARSLIPLLG
jgi:hypothetical protein